MKIVLCAVLCLSAMLGCDGSPGGPDLADGAADGVAASAITITAPAAGEMVTLGADSDKSVPIKVALTRFTLMAPGSCGSTKSCGHLHINIDGAACNDTAGAKVYNNVGITTMATAKFGLCATGTQLGAHAITVELHDDMHAAVLGADGTQAKAEVMITTN